MNPGGSQARTLKVYRFREGGLVREKDVVAVEEPLEIRIAWAEGSGGSRSEAMAVTMRTPGDDFGLTAGFLHGEGVVRHRDDLLEITYCRSGEGPQQYNIVEARLNSQVAFDPELVRRNFYTSSSCGVCGKASLEAVEAQGCSVLPSGPTVAGDLIRSLPGLLLQNQGVFQRTGGLHAAGVFATDGRLLVLREDVGRHNAVDKVVGHRLLAGALPDPNAVLVVSGRASFELVQKAVAAGIPLLVAVGAPSSLAVDLARRFGLTLVGFARPDGFNVYSGPERIG